MKIIENGYMFWWQERYSKAANEKKMHGNRDSTLNKVTNILLTIYSDNDDSSALITQTGAIKITLAGTQDWLLKFISSLLYQLKCTRSVINLAIAFMVD